MRNSTDTENESYTLGMYFNDSIHHVLSHATKYRWLIHVARVMALVAYLLLPALACAMAYNNLVPLEYYTFIFKGVYALILLSFVVFGAVDSLVSNRDSILIYGLLAVAALVLFTYTWSKL